MTRELPSQMLVTLAGEVSRSVTVYLSGDEEEDHFLYKPSYAVRARLGELVTIRIKKKGTE